MHVSGAQPDGSDVAFVDYRIDLSNRGQKVTVYNKEPADTEYNIITEFRLSKPSKAGVKYDPWKRIGTQVDGEWGKELVPLNVGLTFTTSNNCSFFELSSFEVTGVKINNPYIAQKKGSNNEDDLKGRTNYIEQSSKNLREKLVRIKSDDKLDIDLTIPARNRLADIEHEKNIRDRITLCDGTKPEAMEDDMTALITGITPEEADKIINRVETGEPPGEHTGTFIKPTRKIIPTETITTQQVRDWSYGKWQKGCTSGRSPKEQLGVDYYFPFPDPLLDDRKELPVKAGRMWTTDWYYIPVRSSNGLYKFWLHTISVWDVLGQQSNVGNKLIYNVIGTFEHEWTVSENNHHTTDLIEFIENNIKDWTADDSSLDWKIDHPIGHILPDKIDDLQIISFNAEEEVKNEDGEICEKANRENNTPVESVGGEDLPTDQGGTVYSGFQAAVGGGGVGPGQKSVNESKAYGKKDTVTTIAIVQTGAQEEGELDPVAPNDNEEDESTETGVTNSDDGGGNDGGGDTGTGDDGAIEADPE